jgi:hypothetical protein
MKKPVIYTAIFGDYDVLKLQTKQTIDCDFVCFTDNPKLLVQRWAEKQRKIVPCKRQWVHPRLEAKRYRTHPSEVLPEYETFVYMDGSAVLQSEKAIEYVLSLHKAGDFDILAFKHPERNSIWEEANFTARAEREKYKGIEQKMLDQVESYKQEGMPENVWLTATGLLVSQNTEKMKEFLHARRQENVKWTYQDQLSFDYLVRKHGIKRWHITENLRYNDIISFLFPHQKQI